jgi:CTP:molybdopterin cytidylyltransferase MocA
MNQCITVVILAAGLGKRMRRQAKVLHEVLGRPMVEYVVETARKSPVTLSSWWWVTRRKRCAAWSPGRPRRSLSTNVNNWAQDTP